MSQVVGAKQRRSPDQPSRARKGSGIPLDLEALATDLIRIDSSRDPKPALEWVQAFCTKEGIPVRRIWPSSSHPVLIAGRAEDSRHPHLWLATHVDTVPQLGEPHQRPGTSTTSKLYGRGALDMKGGLALALCLLRDQTRREEQKQAGPLGVSMVVTSDEEGDSRGAWRCVKDGHVRGADLVLVPEPTWECTANAAYGRRGWELSFTSAGGHAEGNFQKQVSPVVALASVLSQLPAECTPLSLATEGEGEVTLPLVARAKLDCLFARRDRVESIASTLARGVAKAEKRFPGIRGTLELRHRASPWPDPYVTPRRLPMVQSFLQHVAEVVETRRIIVEEAVGDFNIFGARFPTLLYGPSGGGAHGKDEWLDRRSLARCWRVYSAFLEEWASGSSPESR